MAYQYRWDTWLKLVKTHTKKHLWHTYQSQELKQNNLLATDRDEKRETTEHRSAKKGRKLIQFEGIKKPYIENNLKIK